MNVPIGKYSGGYHLEDFGERFTNNGAEATMVFIGPSQDRWALLRAIFPSWVYQADPETGDCCADLDSPPQSYPDLFAADYLGPSLICEAFGQCLWPDTFSVSGFDATCTPGILFCDNDSPPLPDPMKQPLFYSNGSGGECAARIEVNFRRKHHASWPKYLYPCNEQDEWRLPEIPLGTYIEVRFNPNTQAKTIPDQSLKYTPQEEYRSKNDLVTVNNCSYPSYSTVANAAWCNPDDATEDVPSELSPGALVFTQEIEIRWSGVPIADWEAIRSLEGTVNQTVWLGHPPESVLFLNYELEEQPYFGCVDLHTVVLKFNVMTGQVVQGTGTPLTPDELLTRGIYKGRVGLWNRIWSKEPIYIENGSSEKVICTNWVPVRNKIATCCGTTGPKIHKTDCFNKIFEIPSCGP